MAFEKDELCPSCHSRVDKTGKTRVKGENTELPAGTNVSSNTGEVPQWSDDPIVTALGFSGEDFVGRDAARLVQITEIQDARKQEEIDVGLSEEQKTEFTDLTVQRHVRKAHLIELRESTEKILDAVGRTLLEYFNLDPEENEINPNPKDRNGEDKEEWSDVERGKEYVNGKGEKVTEFELPSGEIKDSPSLPINTRVRAIHIEDLRHPLPIGWREFWTITEEEALIENETIDISAKFLINPTNGGLPIEIPVGGEDPIVLKSWFASSFKDSNDGTLGTMRIINDTLTGTDEIEEANLLETDLIANYTLEEDTEVNPSTYLSDTVFERSLQTIRHIWQRNTPDDSLADILLDPDQEGLRDIIVKKLTRFKFIAELTSTVNTTGFEDLTSSDILDPLPSISDLIGANSIADSFLSTQEELIEYIEGVGEEIKSEAEEDENNPDATYSVSTNIFSTGNNITNTAFFTVSIAFKLTNPNTEDSYNSSITFISSLPEDVKDIEDQIVLDDGNILTMQLTGDAINIYLGRSGINAPTVYDINVLLDTIFVEASAHPNASEDLTNYKTLQNEGEEAEEPITTVIFLNISASGLARSGRIGFQGFVELTRFIDDVFQSSSESRTPVRAVTITESKVDFKIGRMRITNRDKESFQSE